MQDVQTDPSAQLLQLFCLIPSNFQQSGTNQQCRCPFTSSCKTEICLEAAVQCSNKQGDQTENLKQIERLTQLLTLREQQGVGLHLAVQNRDSELLALHRGLQSKDEEITRLNSKLNKIETEAALRQIMMSQMQSQLNCVWNEQFQKGRKFADKQRDEDTTTVNNRQQIVIPPEQQAVLQQNYYQTFLDDLPLSTPLIQNSRNADMRGRSEEIDNLKSQIQKFREQNQELKRMLNDLEWRHFCMESELEMARKEKQELKISCDKLDSRLFEYETMIHDQMVSIYSLKEKNQWLSQDNIDMIEEMRKKQREIFRLTDEQNSIKQYSKQESKELRYQIKEIEEEFREVTECLKMKIVEVDQCKRKVQFLDKEKMEMQRKLDNVELQNYELDQSVAQHQQIMEKQSQKIEEFTRNTDFLNKKLQEECMLKIIRTKEWEEKYRALEHIIRQKNQQLQQVSSKSLEKEIQSDRTIEDLQRVILDTEAALRQSNTLKDRMQAQINQWELTSSIKDRTIEEYQRQSSHINLQCARLQEQIFSLKQQLNQHLQQGRILQNEKASYQHTVKSMQEMIQQMTRKLTNLEDQLEKNIRNITDLECQSEKNKKVLQLIINENQQLSEKENQLSRDIERIRSEIKQIHSFVSCQIQSIVEHIERPEHKDETIQFQVLQDNEHYQIIETEENQIQVIKHKIQQLLSSLNIATAKYI